MHLGVIAAVTPVTSSGGHAWAGAELVVRIEPEKTTKPVPAPAALPPTVAQKPHAALDVPVSQRYLTASELDQRAVPIEEPPLLYPEGAWLNRLPGRVVVRLFISERGNVDRAMVLEASPPGRFEQAALDAVTAMRFRPALKDGREVKSQKTLEVEFDPYGPRPGERRP